MNEKKEEKKRYCHKTKEEKKIVNRGRGGGGLVDIKKDTPDINTEGEEEPCISPINNLVVSILNKMRQMSLRANCSLEYQQNKCSSTMHITFESPQ